MNRPSDDRDLMHGLLAVKQHFLSADQFVVSVNEWSGDGQRDSLIDWLVEQGLLTPAQRVKVHAIANDVCDGDFSTLVPGTPDVGTQDLGTQDTLGLGTEIAAVNERINEFDDVEVRDSLVDFMTLISPQGTPPSPKDFPITGEPTRFHIRRELARGGLGQVFVARDKQLNRNVALKQILERWQDDATSNDRFLTEAEITGRLEHPGVVPVYALGHRPDGRYYYAMRLIRGVTLEEKIQEFFDPSVPRSPTERNLELRKLLRRFVDVCNTLEYAHSRGVIHRDLKPANIMLGKYGETLVVDWGLAKQVDVEEARPTTAESLLVPSSGSGSSATRFGSALGTPQFMSPEQAAGQLDQVGPASDIYGLGATFYQLLTGHPPQTDKSLPAILDKVKRGEFPAPTAIRADVPKPLEAICLKAMRLGANDRYASAAELAQDIERWLADQRVLVYREPVLSRVARSLRCHQALAASVTVATVLLCVAAVVGSIVWQQTEARRRAHAYELRQKQAERDWEDQQRLAERRASAEAHLRFGLVEAKAGRFESALTFFRQGEQACADETRLDEERKNFSSPIQEMARLVDFERRSNEIIMATALQENSRAMDLIASGLRNLGVFDHADWWNHLPVHYLSRKEGDRIEKQVHFDLITLASLLAKSVATEELLFARTMKLRVDYSDRQLLVLKAVERVEILAQNYRESEWLDRLREISRWLYGEVDEPAKKNVWRADSFVDAYYLGAVCGFATPPLKKEPVGLLNDLVGDSLNGLLGDASRDPLGDFLGNLLGVSDTRQAALLHLGRATELEPDNYLSHLLLGFVQTRGGELDASRSTLSHCIALRPDLILAYDWRSLNCVIQARETEDPQVRDRLLKLALRDANAVCDITPRFEIGYWIRGNALREMNEHSQAVVSYMAALQREPPIDMIEEDLVLQGHGLELHEVRRLGDVLPRRFAEVRRYAKKLQQDDPGDARYPLLDATAALALHRWGDAKRSAARALDLASRVDRAVVPNLDAARIISQAYAIEGEVHRKDEQWTLARDAFSKSLRHDPQNTLAAEGVALVLGRLAEDSDDPLLSNLADAAFHHLLAVACTDWQLIRAHRGHFALQLKRSEFEEAAASLELALQVDRGQRLDEMIQLARKYGATDILGRLAELDVVAQLTADSEKDRRPNTLALRNGDFELGLDSYWESWKSFGGCFADAKVGVQTRQGDSGARALLIEHHTERSPESVAMLQQALPVLPGTRYRLSVWAKSDGIAPEAIRIVIGDKPNEPVIVLPEGLYDWQRLVGEFSVSDSTGFNRPVTKRIQIVSTAPGKVWLDDIRIERIAD